jgi:uncharacterized protein YcfJ
VTEETTMMNKLLPWLTLGVTVWLAVPAGAATPAGAASAPTAVAGVTLSTLCDTCAVVSNAHVETRKGKGSGLGAAGGALAGGVLGHQLGGGGGKTAITVLGAVGGAVAGNAVEKNMKKQQVWVTTVTQRDGGTRKFEATSDPALKAGDVVTLASGHPVKRTP